MRILFFIVLFLLILGPLRRAFLGSWRFNIPALIAGIISWFVVSNNIKTRDPRWMPHAVALFVAIGAGAAVKQWLDEVFGKGK